MATTNISLYDVTEAPRAEVMQLSEDSTRRGQAFIVVSLGFTVSIILPGFGPVAANYARQIAVALTEAALACEQPAGEVTTDHDTGAAS
jgi:hypothetical protein